MTMEELEAQLRRKSQQQQQQRMPVPGADPSMMGSLGQLGAPGQLGQPLQLASPGATPPQHMQHGPPGFPHPAGPPQRPPDFDNQHLGTARQPWEIYLEVSCTFRFQMSRILAVNSLEINQKA